MAKYGLLKGLGVGLSQGAVMLNQAMAEDRAVERERMREASIAQRWKRQEEREDARNKVADERYAESLKVQAADKQQAQNNWKKSYDLQNRQVTAAEEARRVQRIEETLGRIQSKFDRDAEKIDRKYDRLLDKAETPEEKAALHDQRDREHEALGTKLNAEMLPALKSFGDGLKGTAYATYIDELADLEKQKQQPEKKPEPVPEPAVSTRADAVNSVLAQPAGTSLPTPGVQPAYALDANGVPELSAGNLLKKWGQNMQPTPISEQSKQFTNALQQNNITSAYGAASMAQQPGLLSHTFQRKF